MMLTTAMRSALFIISLLMAAMVQANVSLLQTPDNPSQAGVPVQFVVQDDCETVTIDYGDGSPTDTDFTIAQPFTFTHVYTSAGTYHVTVTGGTCGTIGTQDFITVFIVGTASEPVGSPTPTGISIEYMQLYFDNNQPKISVARNTRDLRAHAELRYSGSGLFQAYWEVDGRIIERINRHLLDGDTLKLSTPDYVTLPTFRSGPHRVRLVVTAPAVSPGLIPQAVYFVSDRAPVPELELVAPPVNTRIEPGTDIEFSWRASVPSPGYLLQLIDARQQIVFSAFSSQPDYMMKQAVAANVLDPDAEYQWQVSALDKQGRPLAKSRQALFSIDDRSWAVDKEFLLVFENTLLGHALKRRLIRDYRLDVIEEFDLDSLQRSVLVFQTDRDASSLLNELRATRGVIGAQPNYIYRSLQQSADAAEPLQPMQKLASQLELAKMQGVGATRKPLIAVIDSGVEVDHPDLQGADITPLNFLKGDEYRGEIHGTAVTGIIVAQRNGEGIIGLAPASRILALRACRQLQAERSAAECFSHSVARAVDRALLDQAELVNFSFGTPGGDPLISSLLDAGRQQSMVFVAAAGNDLRQQELAFPASHPAVLAVAGRDDDRDFPNAQLVAAAQLSAPADQIFTTVSGGRYNFLNGTSMSTAIATGVLALAPPGRPSLPKGETFCDWINRVFGVGSCGPGR